MFSMLVEGSADLSMFKHQNINFLQPYISTVLDYDQRIQYELENNLDDICAQLKITKDEVRQAMQKHINTTNSHRLIGVEEALNAKIPKYLTAQRAKKIK